MGRYIGAKNRILTGKPSQLGKLLINDLCKGDVKLQGCHCNDIVWGMFREALPVLVRNHIADLTFTKETYKEVFKKADQVWDSNRAPDPLPTKQVAAATANSSPKTQEVAAVQRNGQGGQKPKKNKNQSGNQGQGNKNNQSGQNRGTGTQPKTHVNEDGHCRIHAKWKDNATFCAAPWACKMKNVWKAPQ